VSRGAASTCITLSPPPTPPTHQDPIFKGNKVPNLEPGYPGGIFDPLGFSKGNLKELQTKEVKNGRLAMVAFIGFVFAVRGWKQWRPAAGAAAVGCWPNPFF
jgi:hypothetical protein